MKAAKWIKEIESALIPPLIAMVNSYVFFPYIVTNPADKTWKRMIEAKFKCRLLPHDTIVLFDGDDNEVDFSVPNNLMPFSGGVVSLYSEHSRHPDWTLAYNVVERLHIHKVRYFDTFASSNVRFVPDDRWQRYRPSERSNDTTHTLCFRQVQWNANTNGPRFTYYLIDERRYVQLE